MSETAATKEETAKLAYTIIQSLLDANEALGDLLVVMSHAMDEDVIKAMTNTNEWEGYMESRRTLETTNKQIEIFVTALGEMGKKMDN